MKSLTIRNGSAAIRHIPFHRGINLIVDETKSTDKTESGNSVGKTTVLRLIDFCLDGDGKNIYTDSEFKLKKTKVEEFLTKNNVVIELVLVDDIDHKNPRKIVIERNFLSHKEKIQTINGEKKKDDEFSKELQKLIFKTNSEHPTFKQLKSKNIRDERNKLTNTIRILNSFATEAVYESLYLFWFGFDLNFSKDKLIREKNIEEKFQKRLRQENSLPKIRQFLIVVDKEIEKLNKKRASFNLNEEFESDFQKLTATKSEINAVSNHLSHLEMRVELIEESEEDLKNNIANIDAQKIKKLYEAAKTLVPNIQKTFEETLAFHNEMISQKLNFITEDLPQLQQEIDTEKSKLKKLRQKEREISEALGQSSTVEELETIVSKLNNYHEQKGSLEEQKKLWGKTISKLDKIKEDLDLIKTKIDDDADLIQQRITEFNSYFSDISSRLDGTRSLLIAEKNGDVYKFEIGNIEGNLGTGGKKSQMASFDLSYIKFADEKHIPCLHFILQDQIENVHANQITNLLTELLDEVNCQYVLPVLRDKLPNNINAKDMEILSLSQNDKLFKIP